MVQASYLVTIPTGVAIGKILFNATDRSAAICFLVNTGLVVVALVYAFFRLKWKSASRASDTAKVVEKSKPFLCDFFDRHHLIATVRAVARKRPGARRFYLWGLLIAMALYTFHRGIKIIKFKKTYSRINVLSFIDESSLMYLYTQLKFNFDLNIYSNFRTYQSGIYVLGN
jgi:MFS transporter, PCFT/HCP family, solute carrier family 46, member 3